MARARRGRSPLQGLRVVDLAGPPGTYATKLLSDLGASVTKVEPAGGDPVRQWPPFVDDRPGPGRSLYFGYFNTGKRSIAADPRSPEVRRLLGRADVLVETLTPAARIELGLDEARLRELNPRLVVTSITPFGCSGPYADYAGDDLVALAMGGVLRLTGFPDEPPLQFGGMQAYHIASIYAAVGTLAALHRRERAGMGAQVDVSLQEAMAAMLDLGVPEYFLHGAVRNRLGTQRHPGIREVFACRDGFVVCSSLGGGGGYPRMLEWLREEGLGLELAGPQWERFLGVMSDPQRLAELRAADPTFAGEEEWRRQRVDAIWQEFLGRHTRQELWDGCQRRRVWLMPVQTPRDLARDPQLRSRKYFVRVRHPDLGRTFRYPGAPYRLSASPWRVPRRAPLLDEDRATILADLETARVQPEGARQDPAELPLAGLRVADFTWWGAGPTMTRVLAVLGAEVIRVETSRRLDPLRMYAPLAPGRSGPDVSGYFNNLNAGKLSVTLNLEMPEGRELARRLAVASDVVVDNFRPGVMARHGLAYADLRQLRPDVVVVSMSVMGSSGPRSGIASLGPGVQAAAGLNWLSGPPDRPPVGSATIVADFGINPGHALVGLLAALRHRQCTGDGQLVEVAQYESTASVLGPALLDYTVNRRVADREGNRSTLACPHNVFACAGSDRWCAISVYSDAEWQALCRAIGQPELGADERFATHAARTAHEDAVEGIVAAWTRDRSATEVMGALQSSGVAAGVVQDVADLVDGDPQLRAREHFVVLEHPEAGPTIHQNLPFRMPGVPLRPRCPAPRLGEHTEHVLGQVLGIGLEEIDRLYVSGALD